MCGRRGQPGLVRLKPNKCPERADFSPKVLERLSATLMIEVTDETSHRKKREVAPVTSSPQYPCCLSSLAFPFQVLRSGIGKAD